MADGCKVIEKHSLPNKKKKGNDHYHSMDKKDLLRSNKNISEIISLYGDENKKVLKSESIRTNARRAIYTKTYPLRNKNMISSVKAL